MAKREPIRRIQPYERLPMHHAEVVGGDKEVALLETPGGDFKIQTQEHEYPLDADDAIQKAQIRPEDIKRLSNLDDAGIRGGIHSKRTYLMALHDGSLWIWKQTGAEERDEIFVYELAKRMFRAIVPEVQPVFVPKLGWGSAMRKVAGVPAGRVDGLHGYFHGNDEMMADLSAMLVLDYMTGNPDRHSNNWFIMHNDRLAAIDNGWAGEDLTMSFADVFQPARLAGMMEDERLWPQLLKGIAVLVQDLGGRGDEVRALAKEIGIDKKEAVDMVRLWEPKLASLTKLIRSQTGKVEKEKVYIKPGQQPPMGVSVEEGPRGGHYYESEGIPVGTDEPKGWGTEEDPEHVADWARRQAAGTHTYDPESGEGTPSIDFFKGDLFDLFEWASGEDSSHEELQDFFRQVWQTEAADIEVVEVTSNAENSIEVRMRLLDPETGAFMGSMDRTLLRDDARVHHDIFTIDAKYRGQGTALAINKQAEESYRLMGFDQVDLQADISIGKYAWAQQGYNFSDDSERFQAWDNLLRYRWEHGGYDTWAGAEQEIVEEAHDEEEQEIISRYGEGGEEEDEETYRDELGLARDRMDGDLQKIRDQADEPPSEWVDAYTDTIEYGGDAWDLASVDDGEGYNGMVLGKAFMLSEWMREWGAYKNLDPGSDGARVGDVYYDKKKHKIKGKEERAEEEHRRGEAGRQEQRKKDWIKENLAPVSQRLRQRVEEAGRKVSARAWALRGGADFNPDVTEEARAEANRLVREFNERQGAIKMHYEKWAAQKTAAAGYGPEGALPDEVPPEEVVHSPHPFPVKPSRNLVEAPSAWRDEHTRPLTAAAARALRQLEEKTTELVRNRPSGQSITDITDRSHKLRSDIHRRYREKGLALLQEAGYEPFGDFLVAPTTLSRALHKAEGERIPVELPKGSKVREGVTDEGAHDIDEDTDQEWRDALAEMYFQETVKKARTYVEGPEQVPPDAQMETGPRGGTYYESEPQMPGFEGPRPMPPTSREPPARPRTIADSTEDGERQQKILNDAKEDAIDLAIEGKPEFQGLGPHSHELRGAVKDALTRNISIRSEIPYTRVRAYMAAWAGSSSDANVESLALQMAAARLFGLPATEFIEKSWDEASTRMTSGDLTQAERLSEADRVVRAMYENTQEYLKQSGIESLVLYRGMRWFDNEGDNPTPDEFGGYATGDKLTGGVRRQEVEFHANPLSSWATDFNDARIFANFKPQGADDWEGEYAWDNPTFQEEVRMAVQEDWESFAREQDIPVGDEDAKEKWKAEEIEANYGSEDMWAYNEKELMPPTLLPSLTRAISVVEVPREKVIATALTGLGCLNENEVVISGGEFNQTTYLVDDYDGTHEFPLADIIEKRELEFDFKKRYADIYHKLVAEATERIGGDIGNDQKEALRYKAKEMAQEGVEGPKRKPREEEEPKTIAEMEAGKKEIPEEALAARLEDLRNDPALDTEATYSKMSSVIFEWWTRREDTHRAADTKIREDDSLSDEEKVKQAVPIVLERALLMREYRKRLKDAADSVGFESKPKEPKEVYKGDLATKYEKARVNLLRKMVAGGMSVEEFEAKQKRMYRYSVLQGKVLDMGYDPRDKKLVRAYVKAQAEYQVVAGTALASGDDFEASYQEMKQKQDALQAGWKKTLRQFKPLEGVKQTKTQDLVRYTGMDLLTMKALKKARTYLKPGQKPPGGQQVEEGPRGGRFYESEGRGAAEDKPGARAMPPGADAYWDMIELNDRYKDAGVEFAEAMGHEGPRAWNSGDVRIALKVTLSDDIARGTRIEQEIVDEFISSWATSSSDNNAYSLAMQTAAAQMFGMKYGIEPTDFVAEQWADVRAAEWARKLAVREGRYGPVEDNEKAKEIMLVSARNIVRHVYERTQSWLRVRGIKKVTLGRGQGWSGQDLPDELRGLELTDEQFGRLESMRMEQYDRREEVALAKIKPGEKVNTPKGYVDYAEYTRAKYDDARKTLNDDLEHDPLAMINTIRQDAEFNISKEWSAAVNAANLKYRKPEGYANNRERDDARNAALREEKEVDKRFRAARQEMRAELDEMSSWEGELDFHQNPLSSWSIDHTTAKSFATMRAHGKHTAVTMWAEVPAERVISIPFTGPGCLTENEFLVAGGMMPVHFRASAYTEGERSHDPAAIRDHLNPYNRMASDIEAKRRRAVMQSKHMEQVIALFNEGKIDEQEVISLRAALLSGDEKAAETAKQSIATVSGQKPA